MRLRRFSNAGTLALAAVSTCTMFALGGCANAPAPLGPSPDATADTVVLQSRDDGSEVDFDTLEARVAFEPVFLSADGSPVSVPLYGKELRVSSDGLVLIGAGTDTLYAAVFKGRAQAANEVAGAGDILLWTPDSGTPRNEAFDVGRFRDSLNVTTLSEVDGLQPAIATVASSQERGFRFGSLRRTPFNAVSPTDPETFERRRRYLNRPAVVKLRFEVGEDPQALSEAVATRFVEALAEGDAATVADLFHPDFLDLGNDSDFGPSSTRPASDELVDAQSEARLLVARGLAGDGREGLVVESLRRAEGPNAFFVDSTDAPRNTDGYTLTLRPGDGLFFVSSFTPTEAPLEPTTQPAEPATRPTEPATQPAG
ncbi:MAG: hypothetical protein AAF561_06380 [Planctomycetota bacterium]